MNKLEYQKKAKKLVTLWILTIVPVYLYFGFQKFSIQYTQEMVDLYGILAFILIAVFFYPILLRINKYAQLGEMMRLAKISKLLILLFRGVLIIAPFAFFLMYIMF